MPVRYDIARGVNRLTDHFVPFHDRIWCLSPVRPTAWQRVALGHATSNNIPTDSPAGLGVDMVDQPAPRSQRRAKVRRSAFMGRTVPADSGSCRQPTATHVARSGHDTPSKRTGWLVAGIFIRAHLVPFQCDANGPLLPRTLVTPTTTHSDGVAHDTPLTDDSFDAPGVDLIVHLRPFQCSTSTACVDV